MLNLRHAFSQSKYIFVNYKHYISKRDNFLEIKKKYRILRAPVDLKAIINLPDVLASFSLDFPQVNPRQAPQVDVYDDIDRSNSLNVVSGDGREATATSRVITECKSQFGAIDEFARCLTSERASERASGVRNAV